MASGAKKKKKPHTHTHAHTHKIKLKKNIYSNMSSLSASILSCPVNKIIVYIQFVWGFTLYPQYLSYLTAIVHKSVFPGLFLTKAYPVHYPDTGRPVIVLFP